MTATQNRVIVLFCPKRKNGRGEFSSFFPVVAFMKKKTFVISSLKTKIQLIADHFFIGRETEVGIEFDDHSSLFLASFFTKHVRFFSFLLTSLAFGAFEGSRLMRPLSSVDISC